MSLKFGLLTVLMAVLGAVTVGKNLKVGLILFGLAVVFAVFFVVVRRMENKYAAEVAAEEAESKENEQ